MGQTFLSAYTTTVSEAEYAELTPNFFESPGSHLVTEPAASILPSRYWTPQRDLVLAFAWSRVVSRSREIERSLATLLEKLSLDPRPRETASASEGIGRREGLQVTLSRLRELWNEPESDDYGVARPTSFAYDTAKWLLQQAAEVMESPFPRGSAAVDYEGGITVSWIKPDRQLHLLIPASGQKQCSVYFYTAQSQSLQSLPPGPEAARTLGHWLDRFCEG